MTDLTQLLAKLQVPETTHVDLYLRRGRGSLQWFLEPNDKDPIKPPPIYNNNDLQFFVCGQEGFSAIEADIQKATTSIDLVLWGFDPGMELKRQGSGWPRGQTYGDLLVAKARAGVKVRMLLWFDGDLPLSEYMFVIPGIGEYLTASGGYVPGINPLAMITGNAPDIGAMSGLPWPASKKAVNAPAPGSNSHSSDYILTDRAHYCRQWWTQALRHGFPNLEIRLRKMHPSAIQSNAKTHLPESATSLSEQKGMERVGTHHQKPILIDYASADKSGASTRNTCAYVMGLNSVTDYWDTPSHGYNDSLREMSPASMGGTWDTWSKWYLKPYRDYAIRVSGEALFDINANFVQGWDHADGYGLVNGAKGPSLAAERQSIKPKDIPRPSGSACRTQIVRTYPDKLEASILKAYTLASSNAVNYIYVENQYFQLSEWTRFLKKMRQQYRSGMAAAGATPDKVTPLHIFVVIPQSERDQMVPNTYDTLKQLNQTQNMGAYDKAVNESTPKAKPPQPQPGRLQQLRSMMVQGMAMSNPPMAMMMAKEQIKGLYTKSEDKLKQKIAKASHDAAPANPGADLDDMGIKTLAAMLMTFDGGNQSKDIRIKKRDSAALEAQAKQEEEANSKPKVKVHKGQANDVDLEKLSEYNIQPPKYREIYIHSKLMFVDDVYTTLGSANLNARSMVGDSELNLCTEQYSFTMAARKRVWGNLAGADLDGMTCTPGTKGETALTFKAWTERMGDNQANRIKGDAPINDSFIHPFEDPRGVPLVRLV